MYLYFLASLIIYSCGEIEINKKMENKNKEKRIAWLSVFRSLTESNKSVSGARLLSGDAYKLVDELFTKYPLEEINTVKTEETNEKCPTCKGDMLIKSGEKNKNKWRGLFCKNPECQQKPKWLQVTDIEVEEENYKRT